MLLAAFLFFGFETVGIPSEYSRFFCNKDVVTMTILEVNNLTKAFGADTILEGVSFKINQGERVGLIGENGSGKSTLLKMMAGIEEVTGGTITRPKGLRVGYLAQHLTYREGNTVYEEVLEVFGAVRKLRAELEDLEAAMGRSETASDEDRLQKTMARYGRLVEAFERMGGYTYEQRIEAALEGLGISAMRDRRIGSLSGGEKNVVALARMLLEEPDILLLDEPGNHLDFEGLAWLEGFIRNYGKTAILVSHDRYLLDRTVERIVELEDRKAAAYSGNYSSYRAEKLRNLIKQKAAYEDQQKEVRRLEEMIKRFELMGSERAYRQAQSKQKMLDRMDRIERPGLDRGRIDPGFGFEERSGRITLELGGYSKAFGDRVLFQDVDLLLSFGERAGLLGANGSGKTTLFKDILEQGAWENPVLRIGPRTKIGYYAQEHETLNPERSILEEVRREKGLTRDQAFTVLSKFLFRWEDMDRKVKTLSGGEKSRVQLAKLMVSDANLLLLDEPTNHLDIQSREQVEEALEEFDGTVLVISHDRYFLDRIVDRIVEVRNPDLLCHAGNFSVFWEKKSSEQGRAAPAKKKRTAARKKTVQPPSDDSVEIEEKIEEMEEDKLRLERALAEAYRNRDYKGGEKLSRQLRMLEDRLEELFDLL